MNNKKRITGFLLFVIGLLVFVRYTPHGSGFLNLMPMIGFVTMFFGILLTIDTFMNYKNKAAYKEYQKNKGKKFWRVNNDTKSVKGLFLLWVGLLLFSLITQSMSTQTSWGISLFMDVLFAINSVQFGYELLWRKKHGKL